MTQLEWQQLEAIVAQMTDAEKQRLAKLLEADPAEPERSGNPSLGLFADEPELMEKVIELIYRDRETVPFRVGPLKTPADENGRPQ